MRPLALGECPRNTNKSKQPLPRLVTRIPSTMSLFNSNTLGAAWSARSREIEAQRLQEHNDILYEYLRHDILARKDALQEDLLETIKTATHKTELSIPIWTYYHARLLQKPTDVEPETYVETKEYIHKNGYDWTVGLVRPGYDVHDLEINPYLWEKPTASVHTVIRKTDILQRIALLFGDNFRVVCVVPPVSMRVRGPMEADVKWSLLVLHYFPRGLPEHFQRSQRAVKDRYAAYRGSEWVGTPYVWKGRREAPPSRASTPPPPLVADEPPPLARRSNGGGIQRDEDDDVEEVRRRLAFSVSPCHCGYYHDVDDE